LRVYLQVIKKDQPMPGPYATMTRADMGADVLRIISGSRGELVSYLLPYKYLLAIQIYAAFVFIFCRRE
jgi:crotonobetainyl-CoA:carnitine CoA-transferase CaiB-like acyl-CoA transferase